MNRCGGPATLGRLVWLAWLVACDGGASAQPAVELVRRYDAAEARQAVAVDAAHFYAIGNRSIGKYARSDGRRVGRWSAPDPQRIIHLNSGVVLDGELHCAHSNYPGVPMRSSIESFDPDTLTHLRSRDLGTSDGSATWVDRRDDRWWVTFAHYDGSGGAPGKGSGDTTLVAFDDAWQPVARYRYPPPVVERFAGRSSSGGGFDPDGRLWITGHDAGELYVLGLPAQGRTLELLAIVQAPIQGQGIAWDPVEPAGLWGISRGLRQVLRLRAPADPKP